MGREVNTAIKFVLGHDVPVDGEIATYYFYSFESDDPDGSLLFTAKAAKAFTFNTIEAAWWMQQLWPSLGASYVCGFRPDI